MTRKSRQTPVGWQTAWFLTCAYNRFIRTGAADIADPGSTAILHRALSDLAARSGIAA